MGNTAVGKTMLIKSFIEGRSQKGMNHYTVTIQDFYKTVIVDEGDGYQTRLNLTIWDAAGDPNVHNLAHLWSRTA